ncbi:MAG: carboxymuconolactone decarboxylase family protein [Acidimicrobiia bacterium]
MLDSRTRALVSIGAAVCMDAPTKTFRSLVDAGLEAGATTEEVVGALLAVAPTAGGPRVVAAAPRIALALGYDVEAAFEHE